MEFNFFMPVRTVSGYDAVVSNSALLKTLGKSCLLVTGASSARISGALGDVVKALEKEGIAYAVFDGIGQNPLISACHAAGIAARETGADFIIGIGGGSPLDAAKAVAIYAANDYLSPIDIYSRVYKNEPLPVVLVGTTAGTGSEVTSVAVLTVDETGRKKSIAGADCYAKIAFADPKYTYTVPYDITVSTALDALSHGIEAWFSPMCTGVLKLFDQRGLPMLWPALKHLLMTKALPTEKMRDELYYGSLYVGMTLNNCGASFPHPLGYVLTENYGVAHGKACTAFLPALLKRAASYDDRGLNELLALLGDDLPTVNETIKKLTGLPQIDITPEQAAEYAERWQDDPPKNFAAVPGGFSAEDAKDLLANISGL